MRSLLFLLVLISSATQAADFWWSASYGAGTGSGPTPKAAYLDRCSKLPGDVTLGMCKEGQYTLTRLSDTQWMARTFFAHGLLNEQFGIIRYGDSCPSGTTFDPASGACKNPCTEKFGQSVSFTSSASSFEPCFDGCSVAPTNIVPFKVEPMPDLLFFYEGQYTGQSCSSPITTVEASPPSPTESDETEECTETERYTDPSTGGVYEKSACTTTTTDKDNQKCVAQGGSVGEFQGVMTCIASNKGPKLTENTKQVEKVTEKKPDGAKKDTTTTTTTTTTCVGAGACSTSTTTVVTTNNTNADGTAGSSSSQCKGSKCTTNGQADTGSGSGSNSGSDDQGEEEEEDEEIASPNKALGKGEQGDFTEGVTEWDEKLQGARDELDDKLDEYSALFSGVFDLNLGSGGGSLPCEQIPVTIGTATVSLDMCLDRYADTLSYLRYALLLAASAFAALIVMG